MKLKRNARLLRTARTVALLFALVSISAAEYQLPSWAGTGSAEFSSWDNFSIAFGDPGNLPDVSGSSGNAVLFQRAPGATLTGTSNIYNSAGSSRFEVVDAFPKPVSHVVIQVETSGTELDYPSIVVRTGATSEPISAQREEISRISSSRGATVLSKWQWKLNNANATNLTIAFQASGPHNSLTAVRLDVQFEADPIRLTRAEPALDRWNYPYNSIPGTRAVASTFGSLQEGVALRRHANFVIGFQTAPEIPAGLSPEQYEIVQARVVLTTSANFSIEYDPTLDSEFSYLPEADQRFVRDEDPGRPLELFGADFRNGFTSATWQETTPYAPEGGQPSVFPAAFDSAESRVDASSVQFAQPTQLLPFAIGRLSGVTAGSQVPEDAPVSFELDLSQPGVVSYLRRALQEGKLLLTATSLHRSGRVGRNFPEYYTRDSVVGNAPSLELVVRIREATDPLRLVSIRVEEGHSVVRFTGALNRNYRIEFTDAFNSWQTVDNPICTQREPKVIEWKDAAVGTRRFYRIREILN